MYKYGARHDTEHFFECVGGPLSEMVSVLQGEVIGYVGMTGYATGPHLDFRMKKNGKLLDPLKHKAPAANPVKPGEMELFLARTIDLSARILTAQKPVSSDKKST